MVASALQVLRDGRTYLRILYLLLAFPLALTYFILIVTGLSVGVGMSVIGVGLVILVLTMLGWLLFGRLERELAIHLLGAQIRPFSVPHPQPESTWASLLRTLRDPITWKSLVYVLVEFPFGIFSFTLSLVLISLALGLTLIPVAYLAQIAVPSLQSQVVIGLGPGLELTGHPLGLPFLIALLFGAIGVVLIPTSAWALSTIGGIWARFAEQMLGVDESRLQLAAAQAEAVVQRSRAEQADQSRRELIVNASHELRTPVASISAHVESLLKPERQMDAETRQYLSVVEAETQRLGALVDDLLVLARADADELRLEIQPIDVAAVIDRVSEALAPLARRERNLSLVHNSAPGLPRVMADGDRLAQVLGNLIRNAVNNTPDGGLISVEAEGVGDQVRISVSDTGIGIEPDDLPRIFDRFYRTDESRTRDSGGSGLGLAIVRDLITAMGGKIEAESTPGRGSAFRIWLRRAAA
jgi:two-component system, OmpR family, phosphate regulon sensor histidine kinase PhoR